jgi:hypothetical protein
MKTIPSPFAGFIPFGTQAAEFLADPVFAECLPGPHLRIELSLPLACQGRVRPESAWQTFLTQVVAPAFPEGFTVMPGLHLLPLADGRSLRLEVQILVALAPESPRTREALAGVIAAWRDASGCSPVSVMIQTVRTSV